MQAPNYWTRDGEHRFLAAPQGFEHPGICKMTNFGRRRTAPPEGGRNEYASIRNYTSCLFVKNFSYFLGQTPKGKWLAQQVDPRIKSTVVHYRIPRVARREQHLDHWMQRF